MYHEVLRGSQLTPSLPCGHVLHCNHFDTCVLVFLESSSNKKEEEEYDLDQKIKMAYCSKQWL